MAARLLRTLLPALFAVLAATAWAVAQTDAPQRPFSKVVKEWEATLDRIVQAEFSFGLSTGQADAYLKQLDEVAAEAQLIKDATLKTLAPLEEQLKALGPEPAEGAEPDAPELAAQRKKIHEDIAFYSARIKQSDLTLARIDEVHKRITAKMLERSIKRLFEDYPLPVLPSTVVKAVPEATDILTRLSRSPMTWWTGLSPNQREWILLYRVALVIALALAATVLVRLALTRWFRRDPALASPFYARRMAAAIADSVAKGLLPALVFSVFLLRAYSDDGMVAGPFAPVFIGFCWGGILLTLAWALPRAFLSPDLPAWRLVPFRPDNARRISRRIFVLAFLLAVDLFFSMAAQQSVSPALFSVYTAVFKSLEALAIISLIPADLWAFDEEEAVMKKAAEPDDDQATGRYWWGVRLLIRAIAIAAAVAALVGYANLGSYLMESLVYSVLAVGGLFLLRELLREIIGQLFRTQVVQKQLRVTYETRSRYKFWLRGLLDVAVQIVGVLVIVVMWGVPSEDVLSWTSKALQEFTIGDVRISVVDIVAAILVFVAALAVTRVFQRTLNDRVFPQTSLDMGVRNSLSSGLGYVGLAVAFALGVSALGLDLSNVALIAGALSVGIGFGLQNVVNNFVSGLILLIERPIKVGDWILVGPHEGFVKQIKVRATEIETFQRASVIIPNSELISTAVINWTHKDAHGRVEVPIGVAYGSDVKKVMEVLHQCLVDNPTIMTYPEPFVLFRGFGDSSLDFEARGYIPEIQRVFRVTTELRVAIYTAFQEAGIEIPFPQRDVHIKSMPPEGRLDRGPGEET